MRPRPAVVVGEGRVRADLQLAEIGPRFGRITGHEGRELRSLNLLRLVLAIHADDQAARLELHAAGRPGHHKRLWRGVGLEGRGEVPALGPGPSAVGAADEEDLDGSSRRRLRQRLSRGGCARREPACRRERGQGARCLPQPGPQRAPGPQRPAGLDRNLPRRMAELPRRAVAGHHADHRAVISLRWGCGCGCGCACTRDGRRNLLNRGPGLPSIRRASGDDPNVALVRARAAAALCKREQHGVRRSLATQTIDGMR